MTEQSNCTAQADKTSPKSDAIIELMLEAGKIKSTRTQYKRVLRALKTLGLRPEEANTVLQHLCYHDAFGNPWPVFVEKPTKGKRK